MNFKFEMFEDKNRIKEGLKKPTHTGVMEEDLLLAVEDARAWQKLSRIKTKDFQICITLQPI